MEAEFVSPLVPPPYSQTLGVQDVSLASDSEPEHRHSRKVLKPKKHLDKCKHKYATQTCEFLYQTSLSHRKMVQDGRALFWGEETLLTSASPLGPLQLVKEFEHQTRKKISVPSIFKLPSVGLFQNFTLLWKPAGTALKLMSSGARTKIKKGLTEKGP